MFRPLRPEEQPPPADPDGPPDSQDPGGPCPRCGRTSTFEVLGWQPLTFDQTAKTVERDGRAYWEAAERVTALQCRGCHQCVAVVEERWIGNQRGPTFRGGGTISYRGIFWYPPASVASLDPSIPEPIRESFVEGTKCLVVQAPRAAAVMFRRTIEAVLKDKGSEDAVKAARGSLADGLKVMADERTLDPSLASWAKEIRLAGNAGGHYDPVDDVTMEEATEISKLLRSMFLYLYETPAKLRRSQQQRSVKPPT